MLVAAVVLAGIFGGSLIARSFTIATANHATCEAVRRNNDILRDLLAHVEHRSIQSIKQGVTKDITERQVRGFYEPTLRRIDSVQC